MKNNLFNLKVEFLEDICTPLSLQDSGIVTGFVTFNVVSAAIVGGIVLT